MDELSHLLPNVLRAGASDLLKVPKEDLTETQKISRRLATDDRMSEVWEFLRSSVMECDQAATIFFKNVPRIIDCYPRYYDSEEYQRDCESVEASLKIIKEFKRVSKPLKSRICQPALIRLIDDLENLDETSVPIRDLLDCFGQDYELAHSRKKIDLMSFAIRVIFLVFKHCGVASIPNELIGVSAAVALGCDDDITPEKVRRLTSDLIGPFSFEMDPPMTGFFDPVNPDEN